MNHHLLEDYLDHVFAPLIGKVPYERRQEIRSEMTTHLESLVEAYSELGEAPENADRLALGRFGSPDALSQQLLHNEKQASPSVIPAFRLALWVYSIATTSMLAMEVAFHFVHTMNLSDTLQDYGSDPSLLSLLGDALAAFYVPLCCIFIPLAAGSFIGYRISSRQSMGIFYGLTVWITAWGLFFIGLDWMNTLFHNITLANLASMQVLLVPFAFTWLPLGCIAAALTDVVKRYSRWTRRFDRFRPITR